MTKIALVVIRLVLEAEDELDVQIEEEIRKETKMPWLAKVEKVSVLDVETHHRMPDGRKVLCYG
jgi:hypothetical protein